MIECFLNAMPSDKGSFDKFKNSIFLIFLTKITIPSAKYHFHILFDMIHQTYP